MSHTNGYRHGYCHANPELAHAHANLLYITAHDHGHSHDDRVPYPGDPNAYADPYHYPHSNRHSYPHTNRHSYPHSHTRRRP